jgi:hypothetical protein
MTVDSKGRDLFIVDNSVSGWTGSLRYLEEWSGIANHYSTSPLATSRSKATMLDGKWQPLDKIRF